MAGIFDILSNTAASLGSTISPAVNSVIVGNLPWAGTGASGSKLPITSPFFKFFVPDPTLWDKLVDYRLIVINVADGNSIVGGDEPADVFVNPLGNGTLAFTPIGNSWEFFLPITPQQLSITDAYSINTSATLRGILEEHSGVRFKNIVVQGTFGVWPGRESITNAPTNVGGASGVLQSIFAGTIQSAQNVATQFVSVLNSATTGFAASKPTTVRPGDTSGGPSGGGDSEKGLGTGYYQTIMLQQFLEQYAEAKRNPVNAGWRLVFDIPKQKQSFVVTPVGFTWNENVNRPMEINYNLQLKAWRRIDLKLKPIVQALQVTPLSPGILQQILNTIQAAQNYAAARVNLIGSVRSDVDNILNIVRQTGLFVKGLSGESLAANDLPAQLVSDAQSAISTYLATVKPSNLSGTAKTNATTIVALNLITALNKINEGVSRSSVAKGQLGSSAADSATLNPSNVIFTKPLQNPLILSQVPVSSLSLNSAQQNALQTEVDKVNSFTVADLKTMRGTILDLCTQLSNSFGAGNAYYSKLFNKPAPLVRTEPMSLDEYDTLESFYKLLESYDILTATNQLDNDQVLNSMEYVNALAATSNIAFSIPNSKIQVPVPFGLTMEQIAMRYLGDPQRWLEIATLNFLQEPYIDNNGFIYQLLSNADGRNIVVGSGEDLHVGQKIYLYSSTQTPTSRTILDIVSLSQTSFLLTLDGLSNLDVFKIVDGAYLQAYLPGTVSSSNVIWIPSNIQSQPYDQISIPSSVANVNLVGLSKCDFLLTPQGDLAVTNTGDFRLAAGLTNLVQALTIKFSTQLGTSLLEPTFGLGVKVGTMNSDLNAKDIYKQIVGMVTSDPRFQGVSDLQVTLNGPSLGISLGVQLAGLSGIFPISFQLPTSS